MAVTSAIEDLFKSVYELFASVFGAAYSIVHSLVTAVLGFVTGIFSLIGNVFEGLIKAVGGVGQFIAGNILLLSVGALGAFLYVRYTASGQKAVTSAKKTS